MKEVVTLIITLYEEIVSFGGSSRINADYFLLLLMQSLGSLSPYSHVSTPANSPPL